METEKITGIRKVKTEPVYNISVLTDESYTANGIVVHNCRSGLMPLADVELDENQLYENRDFNIILDDQDATDRAFKQIDSFNDKYRVSKLILDKDLAARYMFEKGFSVSIETS